MTEHTNMHARREKKRTRKYRVFPIGEIKRHRHSYKKQQQKME